MSLGAVKQHTLLYLLYICNHIPNLMLITLMT